MLNAVVAVAARCSARRRSAWLTLAAPLRPRVPQLAFLLVAAFLLLNKVWSPQYSLWLLPLAVLARPRWRSLLLWQATEALVWVLTMLYYLGTDNRGVDVEWFFFAVVRARRRPPGAHGAGRAGRPAARRRRRPDDAGPASTTRPAASSTASPTG